MRHSLLAALAIVALLCLLTLPLKACIAVAAIGVPCLLLLRYAGVLCMYTNTVAEPRLDLAGPIRTQESAAGFIARLLFPPFRVARQTASMPKLLVTHDQVLDIKHAPKTPYARVQAKLSGDTYNCEEAGVEEPLHATDYDVLGIDGAEQVATERGRDIVLRAREAALADILTGSDGETLLAGQITEPDSGENWGESGGKPIDDVLEADSALNLRVGMGPRWLIISQYEYEDLQKNTQIREEYRRIVGQSDSSATNRKLNLDDLARTLGVDKVIVASARKNTANAGQSAVYAYVWPAKYALLVRGVVNPNDLTEPVFGRMFVWDEAGATAVGSDASTSEDTVEALTVQSYRDEKVDSDIIRVREWTDLKILNLTAAQLIKLPAND